MFNHILVFFALFWCGRIASFNKFREASDKPTMDLDSSKKTRVEVFPVLPLSLQMHEASDKPMDPDSSDIFYPFVPVELPPLPLALNFDVINERGSDEAGEASTFPELPPLPAKLGKDATEEQKKRREKEMSQRRAWQKRILNAKRLKADKRSEE